MVININNNNNNGNESEMESESECESACAGGAAWSISACCRYAESLCNALRLQRDVYICNVCQCDVM